MRIYRYTDSESFWIVAASVEDAADVFAGVYDPIKDLSKISVIPDENSITIRDGVRTTKTAAEWAKTGRGVLASTCE